MSDSDNESTSATSYEEEVVEESERSSEQEESEEVSDDEVCDTDDADNSDTNEEASDDEDDEAEDSEEDKPKIAKSKAKKVQPESDDEDETTPVKKSSRKSTKSEIVSKVPMANGNAQIVDRLGATSIPKKKTYIPVETRAQTYYAIKPHYTHEDCIELVAKVIKKSASRLEIELPDELIVAFAKRFIIADTQLPMGTQKSIYPENNKYSEIMSDLPLEALRKKLYSNAQN